MKKSIIILSGLILGLTITSCETTVEKDQDGGPGVAIDTNGVEVNHPEENRVKVDVQLPEAPSGYEMFFLNSGDLDGDGKDELVIGYNTRALDTNEFMDDVARDLIIYKVENNDWKEWYRSDKALMTSAGGGMMGDPFDTLRIKDGKMTIVHIGGSSWKWNETETYQWQGDDFRLVYESGSFGKFCEYWKDTKFDFITGKMELQLIEEPCTDEGEIIEAESKTTKEEMTRKDIVVMLKSKGDKEIVVEFPDSKEKCWVATKSE